MSRSARMAEAIKKAVSQIIRKKVVDPRIGFVSLTDVELSPDHKNAWIYFSVLGTDEQKKDSLKGLQSATPFIKMSLGEHLRMRQMPEVRFVYDDSLERGSRVINIMNKLKEEKKHE